MRGNATQIVDGNSIIEADSSTGHIDVQQRPEAEANELGDGSTGTGLQSSQRFFDEVTLEELRGEKLDQIRAGQLEEFDEREEDQYSDDDRMKTPKQAKRGSVFNKDFLSRMKTNKMGSSD